MTQAELHSLKSQLQARLDAAAHEGRPASFTFSAEALAAAGAAGSGPFAVVSGHQTDASVSSYALLDCSGRMPG